MKRRTFIKQTSEMAGGIALFPFLPGCSGSSEQDYPIIDTHQHLWDSRFNLTWPKPPISGKDFMPREYRADVEGLNFVKSIYMEVAVPKKHRREEALFALNICEDSSNNTVGASICADPAEANFKEFISEFADNPYLKGVRCRFNSSEVFLSDLVTNNLKWLGKQELFFDLAMPTNWLSKFAVQVEKCPETTFILNHCGSVDPVALFPKDIEKPREPRHRGEVWKRDMRILAENKNVICKISGIVNAVRGFAFEAKHLAPAVDHCLDSFGPDKVIFASDWPTCLYNMSIKEWVNILKEIVKARTMDDQRKLFHDNAKWIYKV